MQLNPYPLSRPGMAIEARAAAAKANRIGIYVAALGLIESVIGTAMGKQPPSSILIAVGGGFALFFTLSFLLALAFPTPSDALASPRARWLVWPLIGAAALITLIYVLKS